MPEWKKIKSDQDYNNALMELYEKMLKMVKKGTFFVNIANYLGRPLKRASWASDAKARKIVNIENVRFEDWEGMEEFDFGEELSEKKANEAAVFDRLSANQRELITWRINCLNQYALFNKDWRLFRDLLNKKSDKASKDSVIENDALYKEALAMLERIWDILAKLRAGSAEHIMTNMEEALGVGQRIGELLLERYSAMYRYRGLLEESGHDVEDDLSSTEQAWSDNLVRMQGIFDSYRVLDSLGNGGKLVEIRDFLKIKFPAGSELEKLFNKDKREIRMDWRFFLYCITMGKTYSTINSAEQQYKKAKARARELAKNK